MALETTVVYPQDPFGNYSYKDFYSSAWGHDYILQQHENQAFEYNNNNNNTSREQGNFWDESSSSVMQNVKECWDPNSSPEACTGGGERSEMPAATVLGRRKRRRTRSSKNKEELENQRMTHIAVERNRRKQMNEYLAAIRSMMPPSYVQRGDQASIIGGAINFVKELEQQLQTIEAQKIANEQQKASNINNNVYGSSPLFGDFFTYPQYSTRTTSSSSGASGLVNKEEINGSVAFGDIEVTMVECHANLKILSKKRPKQLLKIVAGLQCLWLTILHLNVTTTADQMVLYTISVKLEEGCQLTTVDDIADFVNHLLGRIEEESVLS
ncbi:hypothetical protein LguiA_006450 [Lonicera macranthoides]